MSAIEITDSEGRVYTIPDHQIQWVANKKGKAVIQLVHGKCFECSDSYSNISELLQMPRSLTISPGKEGEQKNQLVLMTMDQVEKMNGQA